MRKQSTFRHPTDIRQDDRIADLIAAHGHTGYGVYWMILEILHSHEDMQVEYDPKLVRRMAAQVGMAHEEFNSLLHDMVFDFDLFEIADCIPDRGQNGFIRSTITYSKLRKPKQSSAMSVDASNTETSSSELNQKEQQDIEVDNPYQKQHSLDHELTDRRGLDISYSASTHNSGIFPAPAATG